MRVSPKPPQPSHLLEASAILPPIYPLPPACLLLAEVCHGKRFLTFLPAGAQEFRALPHRLPLFSAPDPLRLPPSSLWYNSVCLAVPVTHSRFSFFPSPQVLPLLEFTELQRKK